MYYSNQVMLLENVLYGKDDHNFTQYWEQVTSASTSHLNLQLSVCLEMNDELSPTESGLL